MPQYHIFHQNMRVYGGGSQNRNDAYDDAFTDISNALGVNRVIMAGFTEITNAGASRTAISDLATTLDPDLDRTNLYACGRTALGRAEYIAVSIHSNFNPAFYGRVMRVFVAYQNQWQCLSSADLNVLTLPGNLAADSRGLVYVGGSFGGQNMIVGYIHNMYNLGDRSGTFQALYTMRNLILARHAVAYPVIFGGDFNVGPRRIRRNIPMYTIYRENMVGPVNTTNTSCLDFWVSDQNINNNRARLYTVTRDVPNGLSDHAGISLRLPWW